MIPQQVEAIIFSAKLPALHTVGPAHSRCGPAPGCATLSSTPRLARPGHLPGEGERAGVQVPRLQDAGDRLEVITVANKV